MQLRRFRESVFEELWIWTTAAGAVAGLLLPLLLAATGLPAARALHWSVFLVLTPAGAGLGWVCGRLSERIIRPLLHEQVLRMHEVAEIMREASIVKDWTTLSLEQRLLTVGSDDELGQAAECFNELAVDLARVYKLEDASAEQTETLSSQLELDSLCREALSLLLRQTEAEAGCLLVRLDGELVTPANFGLSDAGGLADSDRVQLALDTGRMQSVRVPQDIAVDGVVTDFRPRQVLLLPIAYEDKALGVAVLAADTMFGRDSMWILDLFAKGMGLALNNALTHDRMQKIASLDPLTGVYNRRLGMKRLREEYLRAERDGGELGVAMFDIDHFKDVNDTYGHLVGDKVLSAVAETAAGVLRESDVIIRYGGEEFLVVLPSAGIDAVGVVGERIRKAIEARMVKTGAGPVRVTVSVGLTNYDPATHDIEEDLLKKADDALYAAKEGGRNRVVRLSEHDDVLQPASPPEALPVVACGVP